MNDYNKEQKYLGRPDFWQWWESVPGWFDWMKLYDEVALTTPPHSTIVEVGVAMGRSLLYLAQRVYETGRQDVRIAAVDPWVYHPQQAFTWDGSNVPGEREAYQACDKHGGYFPAFLHNLYESRLSPIIDVYRMDSLTAAKIIRPHFVFIDADHDYQPVLDDLNAWWATGPEWMAGHDCNRDDELNFPGVWKAVDARFGRPNWNWVGQTCWVVRRSEIEISKDA